MDSFLEYKIASEVYCQLARGLRSPCQRAFTGHTRVETVRDDSTPKVDELLLRFGRLSWREETLLRFITLSALYVSATDILSFQFLCTQALSMPRFSTNSLNLIAAVTTKHAHTSKASCAMIHSPRGSKAPGLDDSPLANNDFILSILRANPSLRDARSYLASFSPRPRTGALSISAPDAPDVTVSSSSSTSKFAAEPIAVTRDLWQPDPVVKRTALVKIQGPFTEVQLDSITRGLVYLEKLGLVSVIVVENNELHRGDQDERSAMIEETMRVVSSLEKHGSPARPILGAIVRLGPKPHKDDKKKEENVILSESHTYPSDLSPIRSALQAREFPVISPFALDSSCRSVRVDANDVIAGLAHGMIEASAGGIPTCTDNEGYPEEIDLTPLRLMIINREGGVPSYARSGYPHLLINLASEYSHIQENFHEAWRHSNPTALSNLSLARTCLSFMPPTSSAIMVSHRSPSSLIANLITNRPAVSSSLPHALLRGNRSLTPNTPTLLRHGLSMRVLRSSEDIDRPKLTALLEQSFNRMLDAASFYRRLERSLDYIILAGDYAGAAIVTKEACSGSGPIAYLDKFAVLPSHQGDGTVDFLWVALHDESYGLGHPFSVNPNGGKGGKGEGTDLVWRSRANNPVNKWYFERSSGHVRMGDWVVFWCEAEERLEEERRRESASLPYVGESERGCLENWTDTVIKIPCSWK